MSTVIPPVEAVATTAFLAPLQAIQVPGASAGSQIAGSSSTAHSAFGAMVSQGLGEVNNQLLAGQSALQELAVGKVQNLHQVMMQLEETRLSFQLVMQVRNRLLEAYQDVMKMQV